MRYLCLVYAQEGAGEAPDHSRGGGGACEARAHDEELRRGGHLLAAGALYPAHAATTVRVRGGRVAVADGPHGEANHRLARFVYLEARDLNEAIRLVARMPAARRGSVELRPIDDRAD